MAIKDKLIVSHNVFSGGRFVNHEIGGILGYLGPAGRGELVYVLDVPFWATKEAKEKNRNEPGFIDHPVLSTKRRNEVFRIKQSLN